MGVGHKAECRERTSLSQACSRFDRPCQVSAFLLSLGPFEMATNAVLRSPASTTAAAPTVAQLSTLTPGERALLSELRSINVSLSATNAPIKSQELYYLLLQFFGVIAATAFGVFSILAWTVANKSNAISTSALSVSLQSNQLALLAYCLSEENSVRPTRDITSQRLRTNFTVASLPSQKWQRYVRKSSAAILHISAPLLELLCPTYPRA